MNVFALGASRNIGYYAVIRLLGTGFLFELFSLSPSTELVYPQRKKLL